MLVVNTLSTRRSKIQGRLSFPQKCVRQVLGKDIQVPPSSYLHQAQARHKAQVSLLDGTSFLPTLLLLTVYVYGQAPTGTTLYIIVVVVI